MTDISNKLIERVARGIWPMLGIGVSYEYAKSEAERGPGLDANAILLAHETGTAAITALLDGVKLEWVDGGHSSRSKCGNYMGIRCQNDDWVDTDRGQILRGDTREAYKSAALDYIRTQILKTLEGV